MVRVKAVVPLYQVGNVGKVVQQVQHPNQKPAINSEAVVSDSLC
jgi:hypothetical protein